MKKLVVTLAAIAIGMSSLFAWTNTITLGVSGSVPTIAKSVDPEIDNVKFNSTGLDIGYIGYFDFGLAFSNFTSVGIGSARSAFFDDFGASTVGPMTFSATEILGVGYGLVRQENFFLGLFGTVGFSTDVAFVVKKNRETLDAKAIILEGGLVGAGLTAVYTPAKVFSIYASVSANLGLGALETAADKIDMNEKLNNRDEKRNHDDIIKNCSAAYPYLKVLPSVGIAWRF